MSRKKQAYANDVYIGLTQSVRVMFKPSLHEMTKAGDRGKERYEITIGFPEDHPDYAEMYAITERLAAEKQEDWGIDEISLGDNVAMKFVSGDEEYDYYANKVAPEKRKEYPALKGMILMKLRSTQDVFVFDARRRDEKGNPIKITDKEEIVRLIYAGCFVSLRLTFATYDGVNDRNNPRPPGVTAYPEQVCFVTDGERLGRGGDDSGQGFASVQGAVTDDDPTGGEE